jgi:hypothetical protein
MKNIFNITGLFFLLMIFGSCHVIGDIFKAGVGFGILIVVTIIGVIIYFVTRRKN